MARGNGRQDMVRDDDDRGRLQRELGRDAVRGAWRIYAFVILSNPIHLVLKTPQPNRARGMQVFLSTSAHAWARRHRCGGHLFQGRSRTEVVEDQTDLGTVTRAVHRNPVRARGVDHPAAGRGRVLPAPPTAVADWSGLRLTSYWLGGRGSWAGRMLPERTGALCPRAWPSQPSRLGGKRTRVGFWAAVLSSIGCGRWCGANPGGSGAGNRV